MSLIVYESIRKLKINCLSAPSTLLRTGPSIQFYSEVKLLWKLLGLMFVLCYSLDAKKFTVMISPEGDSTNPGRTLPEGFERGFTRQYAQALKEQLEQGDTIRVIVTHESGEQSTQEQKANFANRLEVDLYLSLNFYAHERPMISIYYYQTTIFDFPIDTTLLVLCPTTKAYVKNSAVTKRWACYWQALDNYQAQLSIEHPLAIPIKQLEGIIAPAFALELSAQKMTDIASYVKPISEVLVNISHDKNS